MYNLKTKLQRFNKCKYNLYYGLLGKYEFDKFSLSVDAVQADPFAPPSKVTITVPFKNTKFDPQLINTPVRILSFCDAIGRIMAKYIRLLTKDNKGSGNGGFCGIRYGNQKVIESNAIIFRNDCIEIKMLVGLPAFGRTIAGEEAQQFLLEEIPSVVTKSMLDAEEENDNILKFVTLTERQEWLREECKKRGIIAFIANDSVLARASSLSDKPMAADKVKPFVSPKEYEQTIILPDGFQISGMAIQKGITLIAGGGFHGKSTLLSTISHAIYNHIPGDGREYCVTDESAVFLRSEDGRFIEKTNIAPFIHNLPGRKSSVFFQTENASGSSSQAANLIEALESDSKLILIDEDVSATNFLVRDLRMRELVPDYKETITPLIAHIKNLKKQGISLIMVTGSLGDFMSVADTVIVADNYDYKDQTHKAKDIMKNFPIQEKVADEFTIQENKVIIGSSICYLGKKGKAVIDGQIGSIFFGRETIDFKGWNHLTDFSQYASISALLAYSLDKGYFTGTPQEAWEKVQNDINNYGWDIFSGVGFDHLSPRQELRKSKQNSNKLENTKEWRYIVKTRKQDWHAALCRLRSLKIMSE